MNIDALKGYASHVGVILLVLCNVVAHSSPRAISSLTGIPSASAIFTSVGVGAELRLQIRLIADGPTPTCSASHAWVLSLRAKAMRIDIFRFIAISVVV